MALCGTFQLKQIFSRTLTIDHTQVPSTQANFPVLIRLSNPTFKHVLNGGHVQNVNGFDIQFFSDAALTTKLKWEMERYNRSTGEIVAWAKIASVSSASDTVFYMSYGDPTIVTDQSDPVNVWTNSYICVYHLKDGTTLTVLDSLNAFNGTNHGATPAGGQIDGGGNFVSASIQYVDLGIVPSGGVPGGGITLSVWANGNSFPNAYNTTVGKNASGGSTLIFVKSTGKLAMFAQSTGLISYDGTGSNTLSAGTWNYLCMTYSSATGLIGYVNAGVDGTAPGTGDPSSTSATGRIGSDAVNASREWNGQLDEARFISAVRSADWITTEYNNQKIPSTFVTLGAET